MQIENKIALVTGGANGIGFAYCTELLRNGAAHVAILDLANSNGEAAANKLNTEFGKGRAIFVICDVTKSRQLEAAFAKTVKEFDGLDIVINNAGIMNDARWELEIDINYNAVVRGTLLGLEYMGKDRRGKGGIIVNVSSTLGLIPMPTFPIYSGTKHAVVGLSRSFGQPYHYEKTGVRVLTMCPSLTTTPLITENVDRTLDIISQETVEKVFAEFPPQKAESVAQGMLHIIRFGDNGSVWIVEQGEPVYEVEIPDLPIRKDSDGMFLPSSNPHDEFPPSGERGTN